MKLKLYFCHTMLISLNVLQLSFSLNEMYVYFVICTAMLIASIFLIYKNARSALAKVAWLVGATSIPLTKSSQV